MHQRTPRPRKSVVLSAGYISVRGDNTRVPGDVLLENLNLFAFDLGDFDSGTLDGEWLIRFGNYFDAGVGLLDRAPSV